MALTLTLRNASRLSNGAPVSIVLDRRSAQIGRSERADWVLPDPYVSSRHCEIRFAADRYELIDRSTNGTFLLGGSLPAGGRADSRKRLAKPHVLQHGDMFLVGPYEIGADFGAASPDGNPRQQADRIWEGLAAVNGIDWQGAGFAKSEADDALELADELPAAKPEGSAHNAVMDNAARAEALLLSLVSGLVAMLDARARAKNQLGAQATVLALDGNNPLKLVRDPDEAIAMLLAPPMRGFLDANQAVEDAFRDLQAHQLATLGAMQGALRATLARFSPAAIRARAEQRGVMARILPGAREAALWNAYEREFEGVSERSDEAFIEVFAAEFRRAYDELARAR